MKRVFTNISNVHARENGTRVLLPLDARRLLRAFSAPSSPRRLMMVAATAAMSSQRRSGVFARHACGGGTPTMTALQARTTDGVDQVAGRAAGSHN